MTFKTAMIYMILLSFTSCVNKGNKICSESKEIYKSVLSDIIDQRYFVDVFPRPPIQIENFIFNTDSLKFEVFIGDTLQPIKNSLILKEIELEFGNKGLPKIICNEDNLGIHNFYNSAKYKFHSWAEYNQNLKFKDKKVIILDLSKIYINDTKLMAAFTAAIYSRPKTYLYYLCFVTKNKNQWILSKRILEEIS